MLLNWYFDSFLLNYLNLINLIRLECWLISQRQRQCNGWQIRANQSQMGRKPVLSTRVTWEVNLKWPLTALPPPSEKTIRRQHCAWNQSPSPPSSTSSTTRRRRKQRSTKILLRFYQDTTKSTSILLRILLIILLRILLIILLRILLRYF